MSLEHVDLVITVYTVKTLQRLNGKINVCVITIELTYMFYNCLYFGTGFQTEVIVIYKYNI